jgi:hypothetical protein
MSFRSRREKKQVMEPQNKNYVIDRVLDHVVDSDGSKQYLVRWQGYNKTKDLWLPEDALENAKQVLNDYETQMKKANLP